MNSFVSRLLVQCRYNNIFEIFVSCLDIVNQTNSLRVSSSTISGRTQGGESDEDDNNEGRDRFKAERTTIISLKNRTGNYKTLADIPDSLGLTIF